MLTRSPLLCGLLVCLASSAVADEVKQLAEQTRARFDQRATALSHSLVYAPTTYMVRAEKPEGEKRGRAALTISVLREGKQVFSWKGHQQSVFTIRADVLYYVEFSPIASGCTVKAVDLANGKQLWSSDLEGLGPVSHSKYYNRVTIGISKGYVCVAGEEAQGDYGEVLDPKTGKTLANCGSKRR